MKFNGCAFDPLAFDAAPCVAAVGGHLGRRRHYIPFRLEPEPVPTEDDDAIAELLALIGGLFHDD